MQDFLTAIEEEQPTMFDPRTASPSNAYFNQQAQTGFNPFRQSMLMPQGTGFPGLVPQGTGFPGAAPFGMQPTGLSPFPPQQQASPFPMQTSPFPSQQPSPFQPQATGAPFLQPQQTAMPNFFNSQQTGMLQPQQTGANPFRQSMLLPQMTGPASFSLSAFGAAPASANPGSGPAAPWQTSSSPANEPARPASTPLTSTAPTVSAGGIITHATGSRNPFGVPVQPAPPVPAPPTLYQLATGAFPARASTPPNGHLQSHATGAGAISSVASSFARSARPTSPTSPSRLSFASGLPSVPETSAVTSSLAGLSFGGPAGGAPSPLQSQPTGFSGLKAFKPTSSFGANLVDSLPPVSPGSGISAQPTGAPSASSLGMQPTGAFGGSTFNTTPFSLGTSGASSATGSSTASSTPFSTFSGLPSVSSATTGNSSAFGSPQGLQPQHTAMPFGNGSAAKGLQPQLTATPFSTTQFGASGTNSPFGATGALNAQPTGGAMLRPQTTGGPNPFRASMFVPNGDAAPLPNLAGLSAPFSSNPNASIQLPGAGSNNPFPTQQGQQQQQQQQWLI